MTISLVAVFFVAAGLIAVGAFAATWRRDLTAALAGIPLMFAGADYNTPGVHPSEWSLAWILAGCLAFLAWSRKEKVWPFGQKQIQERYLTRRSSGSPTS